MLSADVKTRLLAAVPSILAILEGMGSSESPAQAVAVTSRASTVASTLTFAAKAETIVVDDDLRRCRPAKGSSGRLATRGRVPLGYYKDPNGRARTFVTIRCDRTRCRARARSTPTARSTCRRGSACINTGGEKSTPRR